MFYFFFESRNSKKDPVVIWLTGGPGCSSELAVFYENGPFKIADNMSLVWNDYGWDKVSSIHITCLSLCCLSTLHFFIWSFFSCDQYLWDLTSCLLTLQISNLLYVDQPTGTGFSYTTDKRDIRHDEEGVSNDLYDFLQVLVLPLSVSYRTLVQCILV